MTIFGLDLIPASGLPESTNDSAAIPAIIFASWIWPLYLPVHNGVRGQPALKHEALIELMRRFSELVSHFSQTSAEIDLNPVIVNSPGCTIVDALVIPKCSGSSED